MLLPHLARQQASSSRHMSHTARSTPFFGMGSSYNEHRRQRLESMSPRIERSVLHANIGNEWNTPDSHTWRSQSDLKKQVKYGGLQELRTMLHSSLGALQLSPVLAVLIKEDKGITLRTALARACPATHRCSSAGNAKGRTHRHPLSLSERSRWTKTFPAPERYPLPFRRMLLSNDHAAPESDGQFGMLTP